MKFNHGCSYLPNVFALLTSALFLWPITALAQQADGLSKPPNAAPGACYVQVAKPSQRQTGSQEVVVREAYEITMPVKARFAPVAEPVMVKESFDELTVSATELKIQTIELEIQAQEQRWMTAIGDRKYPASKAALGQMASSGIRLDSVSAGTCFVEHVIDVQYEDVEERVLVKEAYEKITTVPAVFESIQERIEIRQPYSDTIGVPAIYRTESETVLVNPARDVWQQCHLLKPADQISGEDLCRVRMPERYETLTKAVKVSSPKIKTIQIPGVYQMVEVQRVVEPAQEIRKPVPAVYETLTKRVKVKDARFLWLDRDATAPEGAKSTGRTACLEDIPAQYLSVEQQIVATPGFTQTSTVPAEFVTLNVEKLVSPASQETVVIPDLIRTQRESIDVSQERGEWHQVLCDDDATQEAVAALQTALQREGFSPGPIDGIVGKLTLDAVEHYQIENSLVPGGITLELLNSLVVQIAF